MPGTVQHNCLKFKMFWNWSYKAKLYSANASFSVMFKGLQSIILSLFPQAVHAQRTFHALNLATGNVTDVQSIRNSTGNTKIVLQPF
jgi:hypothetical protein